MINNERPVPFNEMERVINLAEFDLDFSNLENNFKDLAKLAAKIAGTPISLINLIDSYTQWSVSNHGIPITQMPREDSVCQYTIMSNDYFEVKDLAEDERFKNMFYVKDVPNLSYYLGIPLTTEEGYQIGALCVLDTKPNELAPEREISPEKIELLKIIASEIVQRLKTLHAIKALQDQVFQESDIKRKVAHDIRGPIGGIIGLANIISEQGSSNVIEQVLEIASMIHQSGSSLLELADEILTSGAKEKQSTGEQSSLLLFKQKLERLYTPQAKSKSIFFIVNLPVKHEKTLFFKDKLLQITGNVISNAIKFTPQNGSVTVNIDLVNTEAGHRLNITVVDSGIGLSSEAIQFILNGKATSTAGTIGEQGYGFGLALVKHLVDKLNGTMNITSKQGEGTVFEIIIPQHLTSEVYRLQ